MKILYKDSTAPTPPGSVRQKSPIVILHVTLSVLSDSSHPASSDGLPASSRLFHSFGLPPALCGSRADLYPIGKRVTSTNRFLCGTHTQRPPIRSTGSRLSRIETSGTNSMVDGDVFVNGVWSCRMGQIYEDAVGRTLTRPWFVP